MKYCNRYHKPGQVLQNRATLLQNKEVIRKRLVLSFLSFVFSIVWIYSNGSLFLHFLFQKKQEQKNKTKQNK